MNIWAAGTFEVELTPVPDDGVFADELLARAILAKRFAGDLAGTSRGQMLSARSTVAGSAGYVAIERVEGVLNGRRGSFVLQHSSVMERGEALQQIRVVPDSGSGELTGLTGKMTIDNSDGEHRYTFEYRLP